MRESFIFYKSFFEAIKELPDDQRLVVYDAMASYQFEDSEPPQSGIPKAIFTLIKPQLDANNRRYDNGKKGGRPPKENQSVTENKPKPNQTETKPKANKNENDNVNKNDNGPGSIGGIAEKIVNGFVKDGLSGGGFSGSVIQFDYLSLCQIYRNHWKGTEAEFRKWLSDRDKWYSTQTPTIKGNWQKATLKKLVEKAA